MATEIRLPSIGFAMSEGTLAEWLVNDGDQVSDGQVIYSLELDKAVQEVEAPVSGVITIIAQAGEVYQIGDLLATIA